MMRFKGFPAPILAAFLTETADVERINSGSDPDDRTTIVNDLKCGQIQWLDQEQTERAGMGSVARLARVRTAVPTAQIKPRDRLVWSDGTDYRIRAVQPFPANSGSASHYELLIEDEG